MPPRAVPGLAHAHLEALPGVGLGFVAGAARPAAVARAQVGLHIGPLLTLVTGIVGHLVAVAVARLVVLPAAALAAVATLPARVVLGHDLVPTAERGAAGHAHGAGAIDVGDFLAH